MKKTIIALLGFLILIFSVSCAYIPLNTSETPGTSAGYTMAFTTGTEAFATVETSEAPSPLSGVKALWLSQYDLSSVYSAGGIQRPIEQYTEMMRTVLSNAASLGFNTVFLQLRPFADSIYPSEIYPPSAYAVGSYASAFTYDPVAIALDIAKENGLFVHAWINPMRGMTDGEMALAPKSYKTVGWYYDDSVRDKYLPVVSSRRYLNPAYPEVRKLITDGVSEILEKYDFNGIHMDDYFYPTTDPNFDSASYAEAVKADPALTLADFRRNNVSLLVSEIYKTVKSVGKNAVFGISPAGNIGTVYNSDMADVYLWCSEEGYIDYICPQVYFGFEHETYDFVKVCNTWQDIIKNDGVKLLVGVTFGKAKSKIDNYAGTGANEWAMHDDILLRELKYTKTLEKATGFVVFCYQYLYVPATGDIVQETLAERNNLIPELKKDFFDKEN